MRTLLVALLVGVAAAAHGDVVDELLKLTAPPPGLYATPRGDTPAARPRPLPPPLSLDESTRAKLQTTAMDRTASGAARSDAIEQLARAEWPGRNEWLLALAGDSTLLRIVDGYTLYQPFSGIARTNPDLWIPLMVPLLDSPDRNVRSAAANALGQFHLQDARADALRPLIPWLANPDWAEDQCMCRLRLVQSVFDLHLAVAIPGLAWVVEHDPDEFLRSYAAEALGRFGDGSANAAMRNALDRRALSLDNRVRIVKALLATGGLQPWEVSRGLDAYIRYAAMHRAEIWQYGPAAQDVPSDVVIGMAVERGGPEEAAALLVARADEIEKNEPELAAKIRNTIAPWPTVASAAMIVSRIGNGSADAVLITTALQYREQIRRYAPGISLRRLITGGGIPAGIATVLLADDHQEALMLGWPDAVDAKRALLACARLVRDALPVDRVEPLLKDPALEHAAMAYLVTDDSPLARAAIRRHTPGDYAILGDGPVFKEWEQKLVAHFRRAHADELIALREIGLVSRPLVEITIRGNSVRVEGKSLFPEEVAALRDFLENSHFDDLGPLDTGVFDGNAYIYIHLTKDGGRRVFMNGPEHAPGTPHEQLIRFLVR